MNELKAIDMIVNDDYKTKVYLKSEADKVIADKDKEIAKLKEQVALLQAEFIPEPGE